MVSLLTPLSLATVCSALEIPLGAVRAGCTRPFAFLADPWHWMGTKPREMVHERQSSLAAGAAAVLGGSASGGVGSGAMAAWMLLGGVGQSWGRMSTAIPHRNRR